MILLDEADNMTNAAQMALRRIVSAKRVCVCVCECVSVCVYIYIYTHTHTHTQIYIDTVVSSAGPALRCEC